MSRTVLMIAFHFPPAAMGSGHLRTLGFARYLPECGWKPIVLSAQQLAYPRVVPIEVGAIPPNCEVHRAFALDARRQLSIAGKYPGFVAMPDRWASWWPAAVWTGLRLIRRRRVDAIWSTYPLMTAHCIAYTLQRITGLPWIADFRDPVSGSVALANRWSAASQHRWERKVLECATRVTLTTPGARDEYAQRYPRVASGLGVIENGYDEALFADLPEPSRRTGGPLTLVHSGLLYRDGRNPLPFFKALAMLKATGDLSAESLHVVLRASGSEAAYARELERLSIGDVVTLAPPMPNREALIEQARADALLLFQGRRFNRQIPAKLYEYLRVGKPILALVDDGGDTAALLRDTGGAELVPIHTADAIALSLARFLAVLRDGQAAVVSPRIVQRYSRRTGAASLAALLDAVASRQTCNTCAHMAGRTQTDTTAHD